MVDLNKYQKEVLLKDATKVFLRPMIAEDIDALNEFFKAVPKNELRYLREDVTNISVVRSWADTLDYKRVLPVLALKNGKIIGDATLHRRAFGWKWHVGMVRVFIHKDFRRVGLGHLMIEEIVDIARELGLEKLVTELPDISIPAINAFKKAGFDRAAVIPNLVKDRENRPVDVVVMIRDIKPARDEEYDYDF
jgi:GNAT superfamily N-acetyltransferase